jgi:hypothetical protein
MRDDGAVVYLNGVEVWRTNMPAGTVTHLTTASVAIGGADESTFVQTTISPSLLVNGTNVLAVELPLSERSVRDSPPCDSHQQFRGADQLLRDSSQNPRSMRFNVGGTSIMPTNLRLRRI